MTQHADNVKKNNGPGSAQGAEARVATTRAAHAKQDLVQRLWYDDKNRDVVVYYLIAVFCLELIIGVIAFFYGITNAAPLTLGGPKLARFPWTGWTVAAVLAPVGLLLLLHLSGLFFSRSFSGSDGNENDGGVVPERVQRFYSIVRHAPAVVILIALLAMGCAVLFVDSALDMVMAMGAALKPYILWIIGGVVVFLLFGYLGRLWFISRHKRMEQEYAYRLKVLETTGIVIMNKNCVPLRYENGKLQLLAQSDGNGLKALPDNGDQVPPGSASEENKKGQDTKESVEDATVIARHKNS